MEATKDYYAIIGVLPSIEDVALAAASRALLKKYHPDVNNGQNHDGRAADIIEAYRVLGSPDQRKAYDRARGNVKFESRQYENTWSASQENASSAKQENMWSASQEAAWSKEHKSAWSQREEDLRSERGGEKPGMVRTLMTLWVLNFVVRSLITGSIIAFLASGLGPGGTLVKDTLKSLKTLSTIGNVNIKFPFGGDS